MLNDGDIKKKIKKSVTTPIVQEDVEVPDMSITIKMLSKNELYFNGEKNIFEQKENSKQKKVPFWKRQKLMRVASLVTIITLMFTTGFGLWFGFRSDEVVANPFQLASPVLTIEGNYLRWTPVENATGYRIYHNPSIEVGADINYFVITPQMNLSNVSVRALGGEGFENSSVTRTFSSTDEVASWATVVGATRYNVLIKNSRGEVVETIQTSETNIVLPNFFVAGQFEVVVHPLNENDEEIETSLASSQIVSAIAIKEALRELIESENIDIEQAIQVAIDQVVASGVDMSLINTNIIISAIVSEFDSEGLTTGAVIAAIVDAFDATGVTTKAVICAIASAWGGTISEQDIINALADRIETTITIGSNGNWFVNGEDSGVSARGQDGQNGQDGNDGLSAFEVWLKAGHTGTMNDFLEWLRGVSGQDGADGQDGKDGQNGLSAFEIWLQAGNSGTIDDFLEWLRRPPATVSSFDLSFENAFSLVFHSVTMPKNTAIWQPSSPARWGYNFAGWYRDEDLISPAHFPFLLTQNTTLYARWDSNFFYVNGSSIVGLTALGRQQTSITIPRHIDDIAANAFNGETNLQAVVFEEGARIRSIFTGAFRNATSLVSITIPASVGYIGQFAFAGTTGLVSVVFEDGIELLRIRGWTFEGATSLESIVLPPSVTEIENSAFSGTTSLSLIHIPSSVVTIGSGAFFDSGLTSIIIPSSVTSIGTQTFFGWTNNQTIYFQGRSGPMSDWVWTEGVNFNANVVWSA